MISQRYLLFDPPLPSRAMGQADAIAAVVLEEFDKLPANRKPAVRSNGVSEWVPLSGIVAERMCIATKNILHADGIARYEPSSNTCSFLFSA